MNQRNTLLFVAVIFLISTGCVQTFQATPAKPDNPTSIVHTQKPDAPPQKRVAETSPQPAADGAKCKAVSTVKPETKPKPETDPEPVVATPPAAAGSNKPSKGKTGRYRCVNQCSQTAGETEAASGKNPCVEDVSEGPMPEKSAQTVMDEALEFCHLAQDFWQKGELDKAIEILDLAYSAILQVDTERKPHLTQQIDDLRFTISKRILEIYASRNIVVNGSHDEIPVVLNSHVKREISRFTRGREKGFFKRAYQRSGKYRSLIVKGLKEAGLPEELSWLPLIESGFSANALSPARALGLWQFIPSTGYKFGLKRTKYIDERLDPKKSLKAAIAYLKELHQIFGDWATVLAAYNCGEARVLKVIRTQNVNYLDNFWDLYERLPRETARYVPRFLATLHVVNNLEKYGLDEVKLCKPLEYETVEVSRKVHLRNVAKLIGVSTTKLKDLNPELRRNIVPGDRYFLAVPPKKASLLTAKMKELPTYQHARATWRKYKGKTIRHRIRKGDTLSRIAKRYGTTIEVIAHTNGISKRNYTRLTVGKSLRVPVGKRSVAKAHQKSGGRSYVRVSKHVVKSGDSLWILARRYDTTTREIQRLNGLSSTRLHIGQVLKIPGAQKVKTKKIPQKTVASSKKLKVYLVKRGDVPSEIAKRYNMPLDKFLRLNRLSNSSTIYPGQKVLVDM
jgi:membrane-bound lytic murein transglycosylase D